MPNIDIKTKGDPILAGLPEYLKDPACFEKIQSKILKTFISTCAHSEVLEWAKCKKCTIKMLERRSLIKALGFKSHHQYMMWVKIHTEIKKQFPLMDWKNNKPLV